MKKFTEHDKIQANTLAALLKRSKIELTGQEIINSYQAIVWLGSILKQIEEDLIVKPEIKPIIQEQLITEEKSKKRDKK